MICGALAMGGALVGCATRAPAPASEPVSSEPVDGSAPLGAHRLPSSIACESEPPCPDCVTATGEAGRRLGSAAEMKACYDRGKLSDRPGRRDLAYDYGSGANSWTGSRIADASGNVCAQADAGAGPLN